MIKRTLFFSNPVYLSTKNEQLLVAYPDKTIENKTVAIEDIGIVVVEHQQITITNGLMMKLLANSVAIIHCDERHLPIGLMWPLVGHSEQTERYKAQLNCSVPLKKNMWQQTISAKIKNQALMLQSKQIANDNMLYWAKNVNSGDTENHESRAAVYYWREIFEKPFKRERFGEAPNNLLNYGYAILRAITARALVCSGLLPTLGIFHRNKYNAYCLADDIMEPYRPFVDKLVLQLMDKNEEIETLNTEMKLHLISVAAMDVMIDGQKSPLMVAMSRTTSSLYDCFAGVSKKVLFPEYV